MNYEDRVAKGAKLLDRVRPDWAKGIAADRLAMDTCDQCILGQLYGDYWVGFLAVLKPLPGHLLFSASNFGFTLRDDEQDTSVTEDAITARFVELADAWRAEIRARLGEADGGQA